MNRTRRGGIGLATVAGVSLLALVGIGLAGGQQEPSAGDAGAAVATSPAESPSPPRPSSSPASTARASSALAELSTLEVKGRAPMTGYDRDAFGQPWADTDRNGCDTRNDMLRRDLTAAALKPGTNGCVVASGTLADPYTGASIAFVRGQGTSEMVQIDHVVALSNSWQTGSQYWDADKRRTFANDPLNLLAVDGPLNQQKGDGDAATWLPPNKDYRCAYVARQVAVKAKYRLWVTEPERDAIARILTSCPTEPLPTSGAAARAMNAAPADSDIPVRPAVTYANCSAVQAAGAAPLYAGQPGYAAKLDRDSDGVACES
ncbi:MAG: DUF1524 domain-containing protein [Candidatus Nanopelagicales bacterium]